MSIYVVGGAVRDVLLGKIPTDLDYVVEGSTPQEMINNGFIQVGESFPVFLHPETGDEYALTRMEQSTGQGYKHFEFTTENVSLFQDLARRDLTINSMAVPVEFWEDFKRSPIDNINLRDPFNGVEDLANGILRHTSDAFKEDPVRMLRIARFSAKYHFIIAPETYELLDQMVKEECFSHLTIERIWNEVERCFQTNNPILFFDIISKIGANEQVFNQKDVVKESCREQLIVASQKEHQLVSKLLCLENVVNLLQHLKSPTKLIDDCSACIRVYEYIHTSCQLCSQEEHNIDFWVELFCVCASILDIYRRPDRISIIIDLFEYELYSQTIDQVMYDTIVSSIDIIRSVRFKDLPEELQHIPSSIQSNLLSLRIQKVKQFIDNK